MRNSVRRRDDGTHVTHTPLVFRCSQWIWLLQSESVQTDLLASRPRIKHRDLSRTALILASVSLSFPFVCSKAIEDPKKTLNIMCVRLSLLLPLLATVTLLDVSGAFSPVSTSTRPIGSIGSSSASSLVLSALSERQLQFWEDVEDGLDDIENFYAKKGQSIDRIRQFGRR